MRKTIYSMWLILAICSANFAYCQHYPHDRGCDLKKEESKGDKGNQTYSFSYFNVGVGPILFIPNVGIGYRHRYTQAGWDAALSYSTVGYIHQLNANFVMHCYLQPSKPYSAYLGIGGCGSLILDNHGDKSSTVSADFVFGKELARDGNRHHFIEMHVAAPTKFMYKHHHESFYFPLMYVKYGVSF